MLMCLAEALLRVPDADTQDRLIRDKLAGQDWERHLGHSHSPFVNASTWALMLTGRIVEARDVSRWDFDAIWRGLVARLGEPVIRQAVISAVKLLGQHFVLGRTIEEALEKSREAADARVPLFLRHAGRGGHDARRTPSAISTLSPRGSRRRRFGPRAGNLFEQPGISVKLTALHPRFEYVKRKRGARRAAAGPLAKLCAEAREAASLGHDRCRGSRAARSHARRVRGAGRRGCAQGLGRSRPRGAGLSEARAARHRVAHRSRAPPAADHPGAAGEGRLLGQRDQARPGARTCRLSGVHAQDRRPMSPISPVRVRCSPRRT